MRRESFLSPAPSASSAAKVQLDEFIVAAPNTKMPPGTRDFVLEMWIAMVLVCEFRLRGVESPSLVFARPSDFDRPSGTAATSSGLESPADFTVQKIAAFPSMTVRAMVQTRDGYLWLGGYKGLARFDGVRLLWFTLANTPSLSADGISALREDRSGNLWIGTDDGGVIRYRGGEFTSFGPEQGLTETEVRSICERRDGTLWVGTRNGLFHLVDGRFKSWAATNFPAGASVDVLFETADDSLWIGSSRGLFRLMAGGSELRPIIANRIVNSAAADAHGMVWAQLDSRANVRVDFRSGRVESLPNRYRWFQAGRGAGFLIAGWDGTLFRLADSDRTNAMPVAHFEKRKPFSLCEDFEGNIWVGVESHGLYRARRKRVATHSTADGLPIDAVTTIGEDKTGRVWLGTFGKGQFVLEKEATKFEAVPVPDGFNMTGFLERRDGSLWVATYSSHSFRLVNTQFRPDSKTPIGSRVLYEDREGALWIGTLREGVERHRDGLVRRFTTREGLASDLIRCLVQGAAGDMWVGTAHGLNRISGDKITRFGGEEVLAKQIILELYADSQGTVWAGTAGAGLVRCYSNRVQMVTSRNGLGSDWIEQILEDNEGHFWLGSNAGILRLSRTELEACFEGRTNFVNCLTLGPEDGMPVPNCGSGFKPSSMKSRSGLLWFCTPGGLVIVDPKKVRPRSQPPPVHIEEVAADDQPLTLQAARSHEPQHVMIRPGVTRVVFRYTALSFNSPDKLRFRYFLQGYDEHWVSAGGAREAVYTRLPAGDYQFHVTASNNDGVSNETGDVLAVVVVPPWWQTAWFRGIAIAGLGGLVFGLYELRVYQHKKARAMQESFARRLIQSQEQERKRVAAELHDSLGQSLQIIKGRAQLALHRENHAAGQKRQLEEISDAATKAITEVRAISHALRPAELDQLGLTKAVEWMAQQAGATSGTQFGAELENVDGLLPPDIEISLYRIAQEGINNVLQHAQASEAILQLQRANGTVLLSIFDNGRGFLKSAPSDPARARFGHGLAGIEERAKLFGGEFELQSAPGRGTRLTVRCVIPASRNES
jgi:signal transduction histidine kinase/ligand-binding sensor domain-containing protein